MIFLFFVGCFLLFIAEGIIKDKPLMFIAGTIGTIVNLISAYLILT